MKKEYCIEYIAENTGRVDKVSSDFVKRSIFDQEDTTIYINDKKVKKSAKVKLEDKVKIEYFVTFFENVSAQDIPLNIVYEDDHILVINKEAGLVVHPGAGNADNTLVNALLFRYGEDFSTSDDDLRPGIVHRLDKDTSGLMIIAKTEKAHADLAKQFEKHTTEKIYIAIVKGVFVLQSGRIEKNLKRDDKNRKAYTTCDSGGKYALTTYNVEKQFDNYSLVKLKIETGRTHQIRVHLKSINHPILGDEIYSRSDNAYTDKMALHALSLSFDHPETKERMSFTTEIPERISSFIDRLV